MRKIIEFLSGASFSTVFLCGALSMVDAVIEPAIEKNIAIVAAFVISCAVMAMKLVHFKLGK